MISDKSQGLKATWEFLDRRIDDVTNTGQSINFVRFRNVVYFDRQEIS